MSISKVLLSGMFATIVVGAVTVPNVSEARSGGEISIQIAPPPIPYEALPPPRRGYVWVNGYWNWRHHRHVWVPGTWVRERRGYAYHPHHWEQRGGGWYLNHGRWDRDGDGVPNNRDRYPDNRYRR
jgi:hypothetical protein